MQKIIKNHHKIDPTADFVSYYRSFADNAIPYSKFISEKNKSKEAAIKIIKGKGELKEDFFSTLFETRYRSIDEQIAKSPYRNNLIEIAAGSSPRGIIMTKDPKIIFIDTNRSIKNVSKKRKLINEIMKKENIPKRPNLFFEKVNILNLKELQKAIKHFNSQPFTIFHEGLFNYLPRYEQEIAVKNIRKVIGNKGRYITTDILYKPALKALKINNPFMFEFFSKLTGFTGRDFIENEFENQDDAKKLFEEAGFSVEIKPRFAGEYEPESFKKFPPTEYILSRLKSWETWIMTPN